MKDLKIMADDLNVPTQGLAVGIGAISPFFCSSKRWGFPASFFFATGNKLPWSGDFMD